MTTDIKPRTRHAKRKGGSKPPDGILRPCSHCGIEHHKFAYCADRVLRSPRRAPIAKPEPAQHVDDEVVATIASAYPHIAAELEREPVMDDAQAQALLERRNDDIAATPPEETESMRDALKSIVSAEARGEVLQETVGDTGMTVAEVKEYKLITDPDEIERLTPDALKRELKVRAALDQAAKAHAKQEANLGFKVARPELLRRTNEKAGKILLNQLEHTLAVAGVTAHVARNPTPENLKKYIPEEEAQQTRDVLARIPETRERKRQEEEAKEKLKTHVNGQVPWVCESNPDTSCYARVFYGASLEVVRRKAAAEPGWMFACPSCRGTRIRLADEREGVKAA